MNIQGTKWADGESAAQTIFQLATSYRLSQAIYVFTRLGIPDLLAAGAKTCEQLAQATGAHAPSLHRLLRAPTAWEILTEPAPGSFALAPLGVCLRSDAPDSARSIVLMFGSENFWITWGDLLHCVRTGETAFAHLFGVPGTFDYLADHPDDAALFNAAMTNNSTLTAARIVSSYDFSSARLLVDVGGGRGALIAAILKAYPSLRGTLFDLPAVVATARPELERAGVADRCEVVGGDVFSSVPNDGDIYLLARVIHDWDDEKSIAIFRNCRAAMAPASKLLLVERAIPEKIEPGALVQSQVLGDLNMLVRNGGRERTETEYRALLARADLQLMRTIPTGAEYSLIEALPR
jgi:O-methyltransferase domain/Dimerisation domain